MNWLLAQDTNPDKNERSAAHVEGPADTNKPSFGTIKINCVLGATRVGYMYMCTGTCTYIMYVLIGFRFPYIGIGAPTGTNSFFSFAAARPELSQLLFALL